ncbi:MAG: 30S ribosomal protein S9 [Bacteroidales bacterium]|jgi:small subunit ribosomal protein S9|nr:30S ribosomal protein S9 [Bacteroidales bacterium]MBQ3617477.1 30S ribosomal protein S9 [Bacteroidales bacterium]MBR2887624.1 30S ribosomal protein S9 [Bacteroidales bacterium]MDD6001108.1 30S ribosomal protein S9 [Bacteroidales bacterium]
MAEVTNKVGRRKAAIARVFVTPGKGEIKVNGKDYKEYFTVPQFQQVVVQALAQINQAENYDVKVNVCGGGFKGQAEAIRLGIARALVEINPEDRVALKKEGFLRRDSRVVERKKPGRPGARKRFQFSKR